MAEKAMAETMEALPKIRIRDLRKSFGSNHVLRGLDLDIADAESVVVIGGSGTGKSVLIKTITGLMDADGGSVSIDGADVLKMSSSERHGMMNRFGLLFQAGALFDSLTVLDNVAFGLVEAQGMPRKQAHELALDFMAQVGLEPAVGAMYPGEISVGMRKRASLARTIATRPDVVFFDEPTTGLDPIMGDIIDELIVKCVEEFKITALTITHDMDSARRIGNRIAMLYDGKIIWQGPTTEIDRSGNPYVHQFINGLEEGPIELLARQA
ncbi:ATP-binding cassette domain-containing protein [Nisaea sp.]|uniref:ABC transporter ATP-binding protein n=1 Tax=Nisaea sp. TaxID=2024842 RepID=UPI0032EE53D6